MTEGTEGDEAPVPRLPRGKMIKLSTPMLVRIALTVTLLVMIVTIQKPCAEGVSRFVTSFGSGSGSGSGSDGSAGSAEELQYEHMTTDMSPEEIKAAMERARLKAAGSGAGAGSAAGRPTP